MTSICIIIPFYNESGRFRQNEFIDFASSDPGFSFCLVNDGSSDDTGQILESLKNKFPERILVCPHNENKGKAEAVRTGISAALQHFDARYFGYFDADLSTPLDESLRLQASLAEKPGLQFAFGSRVAIVGKKIERKLYRHLMGRIIATFISGILHIMVYDTQCGAKLFTRSIAEKVFREPFISRWLFDVEIMARIIEISGRDKIEETMVEVPVRSWIDRGGSKISWTYAFRVFYDLFRIHRHYPSIGQGEQ
jgi:glycosyltransferase involved in cell wall biosynthesis